jgi:hypothetical protein
LIACAPGQPPISFSTCTTARRFLPPAWTAAIRPAGRPNEVEDGTTGSLANGGPGSPFAYVPRLAARFGGGGSGAGAMPQPPTASAREGALAAQGRLFDPKRDIVADLMHAFD